MTQKEIQSTLKPALQWFRGNGWKAFPFQIEAWQKVLEGKEGIVNAPTGSGKTYSLLLPLLLKANTPERGLKIIWISPIRALTKEILQSAERAAFALGLDMRIEIRTGDTSQSEKDKQKRRMPELLITTPESLHILFAQKQHSQHFKLVQAVVVDEWHELIGTKRGNLMELALAHIRSISPALKCWGISATIGNLNQALEVLLGGKSKEAVLIKADIHKHIEIIPVLPESLEKLPWAGHLGLQLLPDLLPLIEASKTALVFTNTRGQAEMWYQRLLDAEPDLAGRLALHHGSISKELRFWVEDALFQGSIKAVICTSSLDLGVDFRPVDRIFQIGSPKGVSRFLQRAGRSGHQPGAKSQIYFVPTHALELLESAALRTAIEEELIEDRLPYTQTFDILLQYLTTLAVSDGFYEEPLYQEIISTFAFSGLSRKEWEECLSFLTSGGLLEAYNDFHKLVRDEDGRYFVQSRKVAMRHRMSIGAIVSDTMLRVKLKRGPVLGHVEEYFIGKLKKGDVFWFAGQNLELIEIREMTVNVRRSDKKMGIVPAWNGGRLPLSAQLGQMLRRKWVEAAKGGDGHPELALLQPMIQWQKEYSVVPNEKQFLIERLESDEGFHLFFYPFEGRLVHEGMAYLIAWRIGQHQPCSFSIAMNDYGFELLSEQAIDLDSDLLQALFSTDNLIEHISTSVNASEMAKRRFHDIAYIAGMVFRGYPGQKIKERHLQNSSALLFKVFEEYQPDHILLKQAYSETMDFQLEEGRLRKALDRINSQQILLEDIKYPSPLCFPILVDRLRQKMSSEQLEDRIARILAQSIE